MEGVKEYTFHSHKISQSVECKCVPKIGINNVYSIATQINVSSLRLLEFEVEHPQYESFYLRHFKPNHPSVKLCGQGDMWILQL